MPFTSPATPRPSELATAPTGRQRGGPARTRAGSAGSRSRLRERCRVGNERGPGSFAVLAALMVVAGVLVAVTLPDVRPPEDEHRPAPGRMGRLVPVVSSNTLVFLGQYTLYTYVRVLLPHSGASPSLVGPILLVFGVSGLIGIWAAGPRLDRRLRGTALVILVIVSAGIAGAGAALGGAVLASTGIREAAWLAAVLVILAIMLVLLGRRAFPKAGTQLGHRRERGTVLRCLNRCACDYPGPEGQTGRVRRRANGSPSDVPDRLRAGRLAVCRG